MVVMSVTLRFTELHLNQTFDNTSVFAEYGRRVRGINLPDLQGQMVFCTLVCSCSPLDFLVWVKVDLSSTPTKSKCSDNLIY